MQTFLPYEDFGMTAKCLDTKRLGKQRLEALTIYKILVNNSGGAWSRHPATLMWKGFETALAVYYNNILQEWIMRGYRNTMMPLFVHEEDFPVKMPTWLGKDCFHGSHRSNLLRKDAEWYGQFGWEETNDLPYYWPTKVCSVDDKEVVV